jgi:hypothetical protein
MDPDLNALMDQLRENVHDALGNEWRELHVKGNKKSALQFMADAFQTLVAIFPRIEELKARLELSPKQRCCFAFVLALKEGRATIQELEPEQRPYWPHGSNYSGPTLYFVDSKQRPASFECEVDGALLEKVAKHLAARDVVLAILENEDRRWVGVY